VLYASRRAGKRHKQELEQRERHRQEAREDEQHALAVGRCWERLKWLVETAGIEPATSEGANLGLGPELTLELLRGLRRDAEQLADDTLAKAVTTYQSQFALVLIQQGGPLSELAAAPSGSVNGVNGKPDTQSATSTSDKPDRKPTTAADETPTAAEQVADGERRHRR
jgi:hypothetical protein